VVAVKINQHFIIHQFGDAARILPVDTQPDIGLLHLVIIIIDHDIDPALESIFHEFFDRRKFIFRYLGHVFTQPKAILAEITIEVFRLVIFPFEFLVLNPVLSEFHRVHLCGCFQV
jgi:hypothetical protein